MAKVLWGVSVKTPSLVYSSVTTHAFVDDNYDLTAVRLNLIDTIMHEIAVASRDHGGIWDIGLMVFFAPGQRPPDREHARHTLINVRHIEAIDVWVKPEPPAKSTGGSEGPDKVVATG